MEKVKSFLQELNLTIYIDAFSDAGYDDMDFIRQLNINEFDEMLEEIDNYLKENKSNIKPGHKKKLQKWKLQQIEFPGLAILRNGIEMTKVAENGNSRRTQIWLQQEDNHWRIKWKSKKKSKQNWLILSESYLMEGLCSPRFLKPSIQKLFADQSHLAFSIISKDRSLDVVADSLPHYDLWICELNRIGVHDNKKKQNVEKKVKRKNKEIIDRAIVPPTRNLVAQNSLEEEPYTPVSPDARTFEFPIARNVSYTPKSKSTRSRNVSLSSRNSSVCRSYSGTKKKRNRIKITIF